MSLNSTKMSITCYGNGQKKKPNPKTKANILSRVTFFFTFGLIKKGFKRDIEEEDIYDVTPSYRSSRQGRTLETIWRREQSKGGKPNVYRLLWSRWGSYYLFLGVIQLIAKLTFVMVQPEASSKLIGYYTKSKGSKSDAVYYGTILIAFGIINTTYVHNYMLLITELGLRIRTSFCSLLYRKALRLSGSRSSDVNIGNIVTLMSKDVNNFDQAVIFWNDMWISVIMVTFTAYLMYVKIGIAALAGVLFLVLVVPLEVLLGRLTSILRFKAAKITDRRVQITQEVLSAIKIVKMFTWESFFASKISRERKQEMKKIKEVFFSKATTLVMGVLVINVTLYIIVMTHNSLGRTFTIEQVFYVIACVNSLRSPITISIPIGITMTAELAASIRRIQDVLAAEEHSTDLKETKGSKPFITLENVMVSINDNVILRDIDLTITSGLNMITGKLGGGKSSLLKVMVRECPVDRGNMTTTGKLSYVSEEPWLFPSSIKDNILFGEAYVEERYRRVLQICALDQDIATFAQGDDTIVDDRGTNLSKGQQARINLARTIYRDSDIYLLDDCLSSLDVEVQEFVFTRCLLGFLKDKIVVMISNNRQQLKRADNVIVVQDGTVKSVFKPREVRDDQFAELIGDEWKWGEVSDKTDSDDESDDRRPLVEAKPHRNIYHEVKKKGVVDVGTYMTYFKYGGGFLILFGIFVVFVGAQVATSYSEMLVSKRWTKVQQQISKHNQSYSSVSLQQHISEGNQNCSNFSNWASIQQKISEDSQNCSNISDSSEFQELLRTSDNILHIYTVVTVASSLLLLSRAFALFTFSRRASVLLHKSLVTKVIGATMHFFDMRYVGNILNRFSKDLGGVDEYLPLALYECLHCACLFGGKIFLIVNENLYFVIPVVILLAVFFVIRRIYLATGRSLKRLDAATRSPVIGHVNATLEGLTTIRAFGSEGILQEQFDRHQDLYTSANHMLLCTTRAFVYALDMLCNMFVASVIITFLTVQTHMGASSVGLAIIQALSMPGMLQWAIRQWAELENHMTSVERVLEFTDVNSECERRDPDGSSSPAKITNRSYNVGLTDDLKETKYSSSDKITYKDVGLTYGGSKDLELKDSCPSSGKITYENVSLTYGASKDLVLKDINFTINPREKVGIVGRTGAGKTSLISVLFRLYPSEGTITIDDVDIKTLPLKLVRSSIAIIPQDPILFSGTVRENIDPTGRYSDEEIWKALNAVQLQELVPSLGAQITSGRGNTFSSGQKQLICLARALVSKNKIIVLDEATANMDPATDVSIYQVIKANFEGCTVLTIAHRLRTVLLYCDKVMVLDNGRIVEFDETKSLRADKQGIFHRMLKHANLLE